MSLYNEDYPVGSWVRVASKERLEDFARGWKLHNKLKPEQIEFANQVFRVANVTFYHGGDVLYELEAVPGIWHEVCLQSADKAD
jgi:hypothetical protein